MHPAMRELLNLPKGVPIGEKGLSAIELDRANFLKVSLRKKEGHTKRNFCLFTDK